MRLTVMALAAALFVSPVGASDDDYSVAVKDLVDAVIIPAHEQFQSTAAATVGSVKTLCASPSAEALSTSRSDFRSLVTDFSAIELYRFGPAREDNRIERLFFWPDRRGVTLRQVQGLLGKEDDSAITVETLKEKSVAVQGLPALEFILFGTGSDELAETAGYRCAYGLAIAGAIATVADDLAEGWRGSFRETLTRTGPDNPRYRSSEEALQDILQAAAEQLEFTLAFKLGVVGSTVGEGRPKRAPFWRSDTTIPAMVANLEAVRTLLRPSLAALLAEVEVLASSADFELSQSTRALQLVGDAPAGFLAAAGDADQHRRLVFAKSPLAAAGRLLAERIPGSLGLIQGFNSLDGD